MSASHNKSIEHYGLRREGGRLPQFIKTFGEIPKVGQQSFRNFNIKLGAVLISEHSISVNLKTYITTSIDLTSLPPGQRPNHRDIIVDNCKKGGCDLGALKYIVSGYVTDPTTRQCITAALETRRRTIPVLQITLIDLSPWPTWLA
ncbi:hypothetical protein F4677DRAFT_280900 [Hypoxylon crocopeplum]|nr:hypothetical protein F4677DRAFT_280900 [Hypoxylon crocopeplum]